MIKNYPIGIYDLSEVRTRKRENLPVWNFLFSRLEVYIFTSGNFFQRILLIMNDNYEYVLDPIWRPQLLFKESMYMNVLYRYYWVLLANSLKFKTFWVQNFI